MLVVELASLGSKLLSFCLSLFTLGPSCFELPSRLLELFLEHLADKVLHADHEAGTLR